jgi:hypothetical protein
MRKKPLSLAVSEVALFVLLGSATLFAGCATATVFSPEPELVAPLPGPDSELARLLKTGSDVAKTPRLKVQDSRVLPG